MLLLVYTALHQYAIRRDDLAAIRVIAGQADLDQLGSRDRPAMPIGLGELLDPHDHARQTRQHGLIVPLRRRPLVFLVERVEQTIEAPIIHPIPVLIAKHLRDTWAVGVIEINQMLTILLDLRAIARSILAQRSIADR
jgi:chemotaxis signal transduction protein